MTIYMEIVVTITVVPITTVLVVVPVNNNTGVAIFTEEIAVLLLPLSHPLVDMGLPVEDIMEAVGDMELIINNMQ
jgi:hypothetical protein